VLNVQTKQFPTSHNEHGESSEGPTERTCTKNWSCQLYHREGDSHGRRSASGYVFSQRTSRYYSGASHDFMSSTCAKKAKLSLVASGAPYVISTPGGRVDANRIVQKTPLELSGRIFRTNLIILGGKDIDVILGMSWMKLHRAVLDIAGRFVH
jgi:hypothetical protein